MLVFELIGVVGATSGDRMRPPAKRRRLVEVMCGLKSKRVRLGVIAGDECDLGLGEIEQGGDETALAPELDPGFKRGNPAAVEERWQ